jgi:hypothetical protein
MSSSQALHARARRARHGHRGRRHPAPVARARRVPRGRGLRARRRVPQRVRRARRLAARTSSTRSRATSIARAARCSPRPRSTSCAWGACLGQRGSFDALPTAASAACPSSAASCPSPASPRRSRPATSKALVTIAGNPVSSDAQRRAPRTAPSPPSTRWSPSTSTATRPRATPSVFLPDDVRPRARALRSSRCQPRLRPQLRALVDAGVRGLRPACATTGTSSPASRAGWRYGLKEQVAAQGRARALGPRRVIDLAMRARPARGSRSTRSRRRPHGVDLGAAPAAPARRVLHTQRPAACASPRSASSTTCRRLRHAARSARVVGGRAPAHRSPQPAQQQLVDAQQPAPREGPRALHAAHAPAPTPARAG